MNEHGTPCESGSQVDEMVADLELNDAEAAQMRGLLREIAGLADETPIPSEAVRAMVSGAIPLRSRRRVALVAVAAGSLALSGVSAAAAANRLPDPIQEMVAELTAPLPVKAPRPDKPVRPVDAPNDAPGQLKDRSPSKPDKPDAPTNTDAPGQIQKLTKPDPGAPGPARPADPGAHGRAHQEDQTDDEPKENNAGGRSGEHRSDKSDQSDPAPAEEPDADEDASADKNKSQGNGNANSNANSNSGSNGNGNGNGKKN
jgi:hypothetical protein